MTLKKLLGELNWLLLNFILAFLCSAGFAQTGGYSDQEISEQLTELAQANSAYYAYDTVVSIPVDSLVLWLQQKGDDESIAISKFLTFQFLPLSESIYESIVAGNQFYVSRHLIPINFRIEGLLHLGECYQQAGKDKERIDVVTEACELRTERRGTEQCFEIAKVFYDLKQYETAIESYRANARYCNEDGFTIMEASSYNDIANCYTELGQIDSAIANFKYALEVLKKPIDPFYENGYLKYFKNIIEWNLLELVDADEFSSQKIDLIQEITTVAEEYLEVHWMLRGYKYLADFKFSSEEYSSVISYCDTGIQTAKRFSVYRKIPPFLELKGKVCLLQDEKTYANEAFARASFIRDSLELASSELQATASAAFYESREKEEQIAALGLKAEEEQRRSRTVLIGASLATLVAFVLGILAISLVRSRKRVREQSQALEESLKDKEVLLKEIHHRVKNNLQVISSLLDLQSIKMDDGTAKSALDEGKSRVQSIAILHHQLYQHDDLAKVELSAFTKELFTQVQGVFSKPGQEVEISYDMAETMIDIDAAVPLGLILNELCTNSFKYAFENSKVGRISVTVSEMAENSGQATRKLVYLDNGPGLPEDFDLSKAKSLGLRLISKLSKQFKGTSSYKYNCGAEFTILF